MTYQNAPAGEDAHDGQDDERPGHDRLALVGVGRRVAVVAVAMRRDRGAWPMDRMSACSSSCSSSGVGIASSAGVGNPRGSPAKTRNHIRNM